MVSLDVMREYICLVETKSFTATARKLYLTQPTVTRHMQELERDLGCALLERTTHGVATTKAGDCAYEGFRRVLDAYERFERDLDSVRRQESGEVRLAVLYHGVAELAIPVVGRFAERYPGVRVSFVSTQPKQAADMLGSNEVDVAIIPEVLAQEREFDFAPLVSARLCCVVDASSPLASRDSVTLDELSNLTELYVSETLPSSAMGSLAGCKRRVDAHQIDMVPLFLSEADRFVFSTRRCAESSARASRSSP